MAIVIASVLRAEVVYSEVRTAGPNGRRKALTTVKIVVGKAVVAEKAMQGRFSQRQALLEFKRNPKGWQVYDADLARMPIAA
jgi:hypothetical protein